MDKEVFDALSRPLPSIAVHGANRCATGIAHKLATAGYPVNDRQDPTYEVWVTLVDEIGPTPQVIIDTAPDSDLEQACLRTIGQRLGGVFIKVKGTCQRTHGVALHVPNLPQFIPDVEQAILEAFDRLSQRGKLPTGEATLGLLRPPMDAPIATDATLRTRLASQPTWVWLVAVIILLQFLQLFFPRSAHAQGSSTIQVRDSTTGVVVPNVGDTTNKAVRTFISNVGHFICDSGCGSPPATADKTAFVFGTSNVTPIAFVVDDVATDTVPENSYGAARMTTNREALAYISNIPHFICDSGCGTPAATADNTAFTAGTTNVTPIAGVYDDSITDLTTGRYGAPRLTQKRGVHTNIRTAAGVEVPFPSALVGGRFDVNTGAWLGSTAPTVGQKTMANSLPVTIASNQTAILVDSATFLPVRVNGGSASSGQTLNAVTGNATGTTITASTNTVAMFTVTCTACAGGTTVNFQAQDGLASGFVSLLARQVGTNTFSASTTTAGVTYWEAPALSMADFRATVSAYSAGTITVFVSFPGGIGSTLTAVNANIIGAVPVTDNGGSLTVDGTVTATVASNGATGSAVPASADYQGINVSGTLRGATGLALGSTFSPTIALVDASGNQITSFGGGTQYTQDAALTVGSTIGTMAMGRASAAAPTDVSADNDAVIPWYLRNGSPVANLAFGGTLVTGTGSSLNVNCTGGCSGGTQYTQDAALTVGTTVGTMAMGRASAAAPTDVSADNDAVIPWYLRNGSPVANLAFGGTLVTGTGSSLNVNCTGGCSGGTQYTQDAALTVATTVGAMAMGRASAAAPTDVSADNDAVIPWYLRSGALVTQPTFAGVLQSTGNGTAGTGTPRVTIASDNTAFAVNATVTNSFLLDATYTGRMPAGASPADAESNTSTSLSRIGTYLFGYNGSTWDRLRATTANGLAVDVTRVQGTVTVSGTVTTTPPANASTNVAQFGGSNVVTVAAGIPKVGSSDSAGNAFLSAANALNSTGTGVQATQGVAQFDDVSPTAITENQFGNLRMSANRNAYTTIRDAAGNERGVNVSAANALIVDGSAVTQPISGSVGVTGLLAHDAPASAANPLLVGAYASAAAPTDVSADTDAVRLWALRSGAIVNQPSFAGTLAVTGNGTVGGGVQRVAIASDNTAFTVNAAQSGTWTVQQGTPPWSVIGTLTNNNAAPSTTNVGALVARATASAPSYSEGNMVTLSTDNAGALRVSGSAGGGVAQTQVRDLNNSWQDVGYQKANLQMPVSDATTYQFLSQLLQAVQQSAYIKGTFGKPIGSINDALKVYPVTPTDPCGGTDKANVAISQTATTRLVPGKAGYRIFVCAARVVAGVAEIVNFTEGTGTTCGTAETAVSGSTTAANGESYAANGGFAEAASVALMITSKQGDDLCLKQSGAQRLSGNLVFAYVP